MGAISTSWPIWLAAAVLASLAGYLILRASALAARRAAAGGEDPTQAVYRRQLHDLDELADRGLLAEDERQAARAEAARRLLNAPAPPAETVTTRRWPLVAAGAAGLLALGLYLALGSPGAADQPFQARIAHWRDTPLAALRPDEVAAVLREVAKTRPNDPRLFALLGQAERAAGDSGLAVRDLRRAAALDPRNANLRAMLAEAMAGEAGDKATPEVLATLNAALALDPHNPRALFDLGGAEASLGQGKAAAATWRRLAGELDPKDGRRAQLIALADRAEKGPAAEPATAAASPDQAEFIRGMVASLQARLDQTPDDPAGWARLVRSYRVLGDAAAMSRALARARTQFAKDPAKLGPIEAEAVASTGKP